MRPNPRLMTHSSSPNGDGSYFIDYLASMQKLDKGAHGYAGFFVNR